jgi:hypothetical protein
MQYEAEQIMSILVLYAPEWKTSLKLIPSAIALIWLKWTASQSNSSTVPRDDYALLHYKQSMLYWVAYRELIRKLLKTRILLHCPRSASAHDRCHVGDALAGAQISVGGPILHLQYSCKPQTRINLKYGHDIWKSRNHYRFFGRWPYVRSTRH